MDAVPALVCPPCACSARENQERALHALDLPLTVVCYQVRAANLPGFSGTAANASSPCAASPALHRLTFYRILTRKRTNTQVRSNARSRHQCNIKVHSFLDEEKLPYVGYIRKLCSSESARSQGWSRTRKGWLSPLRALSWKREDQSWNLQNPCKMPGAVVCICKSLC